MLGAEYYHTAEVLTLLLTPNLLMVPETLARIGKNTPEELEKLNWKGDKIREHSYPDEKINIGVDFDGVIINVERILWVQFMMTQLKERTTLWKDCRKYTIIMYTAKAKPDRGLVNGKTGRIGWEWLEKYDMSKFVAKGLLKNQEQFVTLMTKVLNSQIGIHVLHDWKKKEFYEILITGHKGYIGSRLYKKLINLGYNVVGIDLKDNKSIIDCLPDENYDYVFHLAAFPSVQFSVENPSYTMKNNVLSSSVLLEWCVKNKVKRLIFSSSAAAESIESPYGLQKRITEMECNCFQTL